MGIYPDLEGILKGSSRFADKDASAYLTGEVVKSYISAIHDADYWASADAIKGKGLTKLGRMALKSEEFGGRFSIEDIARLYQNALAVFGRMKALNPSSERQKKGHEVMLSHQAVDLGYFAYCLYQRWPEKKDYEKSEKGLWALKAYTRFSDARRTLNEREYLRSELFKEINDGDLYGALKDSALSSQLPGVAKLAVVMGELILGGRTKKKVREQILAGNKELREKFDSAA